MFAPPTLAAAGTLLLLERVPDLPSRPAAGLFSSPDAAFTGTAYVLSDGSDPTVGAVQIGVDIGCPEPPCNSGGWALAFGVPAGTTLGVGTYEHATADVARPAGAYLEIRYNSTRCFTGDGRFIVHELELDAAGALRSFAADFEQACEDGSGVVGAIRFHAGDAACAAADGTGCNDRNPCTAGDRCHAGRCDGAPTSGTCSPLTCADGNPCTDDAVDASGTCRHTPIGGTCWDVSAKSTLLVTALGRTCACRLPRAQGRLALRDDGTFVSPGGEVGADACPSGRAVAFPDEVGTWAQRKGRGRVLHTTNLADLLDAAVRCAGSSDLVVRGYHTRVRLSADGERLVGTQVMRGRIAGVPASMRLVARLRGAPGTGAAAVPLPSIARIGAAAERCSRRLTGCFQR